MVLERIEDPVYYLTNMEKLIEVVTGLYSDVLNEQEKTFVNTFQELPMPSRCLYARLLSRKGPFFRVEKLCYQEIGLIEAAAGPLVQSGFLTAGHEGTPFEVLELFSKSELNNLGKLFGHANLPSINQKKEKWVVNLIENPGFLEWIHKRQSFLTLKKREYIELFQILFFGNSYQDLTSFILSHLQIVNFESYPLDSSTRMFQNRDEIDAVFELKRLRDVFDWAIINDLPEEVKKACLDFKGIRIPGTSSAYLMQRYERFCHKVGGYYEKIGNYDKAIEWFTYSRTPPAREKQARLYMKMGQPDKCLELLAVMKKDPESPDEWYFGTFCSLIKDRPDRYQGLEFHQQALSYKGRVEEAVMEWLGHDNCFFTENVFWKSILGLCFWDIIFLPVQGAFVNPFQSGPLDLMGPEFRPRRKTAIQFRLSEITRETSWIERAISNFQCKRGITNALVNWDYLETIPVEKILHEIPGQACAKVFDRMLSNLNVFRTGLPDLLYLKKGNDPSFQFIEVKGPGDVLRPNQLAWLNYFKDQGIPAMVLQVRPAY